MDARTAHASPVLEANALSFSYGDRQALRDVSFSIARGEIFGFLGPNGGGKTTLFRILSSLVPAASGTVRMLGHDLNAEQREVRRHLGVVFQHPSVDGKLTVAENLEHHGHLYGITGRKLRERSAAMLEQMGLGSRANDLVETLSGGLQRRTELAKALLHEPRTSAARRTQHRPRSRRPARVQQLSGAVARARRRHDRADDPLHGRSRAMRPRRRDASGPLVAVAPPGELKASIGGDVVVIHARAPETLERKLRERLGLAGRVVDGTIRIERLRGHELVGALVDDFGDEIESVSVGKPTLEDVFVHLTGHQFFAGEAARFMRADSMNGSLAPDRDALVA